MDMKASAAAQRIEKDDARRAVLRDEMRSSRGLFVGLALSSVIWLLLLVVWLAL